MDSERDKHPERRQYFRHQYPLAKRPTLEIEGQTFPIADISEHGLRIDIVYISEHGRSIETVPGMAFVEGATVDMTIHFTEGEGLARSGTIVRQQGPYAGIFLSEAIPSAYFVRSDSN